MRRRWEALVLMAALVLGAVGGLAGASPAAAQTFTCSYTVNPTVLPPEGGIVTVSGTAPGSTTVRLFVGDTQIASTVSAPVTGEWSVDVFITTSVTITAALDDYPTTPCIGVGGENVERLPNGSIVVRGETARRNLAYTGSSETRPVVLIGLGAVCLGLVLLVAARRRISVHGRE